MQMFQEPQKLDTGGTEHRQIHFNIICEIFLHSTLNKSRWLQQEI